MPKFTLPEGVEQKPKKFHERESAVEAHLVGRTKARGEIAYKFTSPQRRSVPDRLVLGDADKAAHELDAILDELGISAQLELSTLRGYAKRIAERMVHFVELKATGAKPTELQEREHAKLRARGFTVLVINSKAEVDRLYGKED